MLCSTTSEMALSLGQNLLARASPDEAPLPVKAAADNGLLRPEATIREGLHGLWP